MRMKLTPAGKQLYNVWWENYCRENDKMGGNSAEGNFCEGWCIVDDRQYVKTLTDVCGLLIFGYDSYALDTVDEWIYDMGADEMFYDFTHAEIREELAKYFTEDGNDYAYNC